MADDSRSRLDLLEARSCQFAIDVIHFARDLERQTDLRSIAGQLRDSATSFVANHRAVRRARSTREFAAKLGVVHEEADETVHWLTVIRATNRDAALIGEVHRLLREGTELRGIFAASRRTTRERYPRPTGH